MTRRRTNTKSFRHKTITLSEEILPWLRTQGNASALIESLLTAERERQRQASEPDILEGNRG